MDKQASHFQKKNLSRIIREAKFVDDLFYFVEKFDLPACSQLLRALQSGSKVSFDEVVQAHKELEKLYSRGIIDIVPLWDQDSLLTGRPNGLERSDFHTLGALKSKIVNLMNSAE